MRRRPSSDGGSGPRISSAATTPTTAPTGPAAAAPTASPVRAADVGRPGALAGIRRNCLAREPGVVKTAAGQCHCQAQCRSGKLALMVVIVMTPFAVVVLPRKRNLALPVRVQFNPATGRGGDAKRVIAPMFCGKTWHGTGIAYTGRLAVCQDRAHAYALLRSPLAGRAAHRSCSAEDARPRSDAATAEPGVLRATLGNGLRVVIVRNSLAPVGRDSVNYLVGSERRPRAFPAPRTPRST